MAKAIVGAAGIETISGALKKPVRKNGHNHGNYLIATHRTAETTNPNCQRLYVHNADAYKRTTPVKASEIQQRSRFGSIAAAVNARLKDPTKMAADQAAYRAQKDTAGGKQSLRSYLWSLEMAAYDNQ
ncbi:MAG: hypothetical protein IJU36_02895 [Paludibacteraceae bacterium]|nr:hypothetical protein [Paludibacteraceae bacterium]